MRPLAILAVLSCLPRLFSSDFDPSLQGMRFFAYQLQNFDSAEGLQALADSHYDMLVMDQTRSILGEENYNSAADVALLHATTGSSVICKKVVCYLDPGQAEDFRWYWQDGWGVGNPAWILAPDPDGWAGDYPVKFWDPAWKALMKQDLAMIVADGYDGAYLDWMEIYSFGPLVQAAQAEGLDPRVELIKFIRELRDYARSLNPDFFLIAQNAAELGAYREWLDLFSGIGQEDVWFTWGDGGPGDVPQDPDLTAEILSNLALWQKAGKVVFDIEYAQVPANVSTAYADGKANGLITYVSLEMLDQLSDTPPPDYRVYNLTTNIDKDAGSPAFSPDGQWIVFAIANEGIYKIKTDASDAQLLMNDPAHQYFTMAGSSWNAVLDRICFTSDRGGNLDIWTIKSDGSDLQQLTHGPGNNKEATFSPDGEWIVFASDRDGQWEIYKQRLTSGEVVQLTTGSMDNTKPNWSPSGDFIVYVYNGAWPVLQIMNVTGTWAMPVGFGISWDPSFSPDGQWMVYMSSGDYNWDPMLTLTPVHEPYAFYWLFYDGTGAGPSFSPDGKTLAWVSGPSGGADIWTIPIYLPPLSPHTRPLGRP